MGKTVKKKSDWQIVTWKRWYLVQYMGHTVEQFLSRDEAEAYKEMRLEPCPCLQAVPMRGQTMRRISIYP